MLKKFGILLTILLVLQGCRGWESEEPPIHPNINMDFQPKIKAQKDPLPVPNNTVQFNFNKRKTNLSDHEINQFFVKNGQKQYNIHCAACHTKTGNGTKSIISQNGWVVSNILEDVTYNRSDDELYDIIDQGIRSMPGYGKKLSDKEMWQIVTYVRALQKMDRVSNQERNKLNQRGSNGK